MKKKSNKTRLQEYLDFSLRSSKSISESFPKVLRFFIDLFFKLFFLIILPLIIIPISPIIIMIGILKKKDNPCNELVEDLKTRWHSESSHTALIALRSIQKKMEDNFKNLFTFKGIKINPYGKFKWDEYIQFNNLLYHWELQHDNVNEAMKICDNILKRTISKSNKSAQSSEIWIVYKARIIAQTEGNQSAQKFLMQYIDPQKKESPIKEYLYELRKTTQ